MLLSFTYKVVLTALIFILSPMVSAQWRQDIADSRWSYNGSRISCKLTHQVDGIGTAQINWRSGEQESFGFTWLFQRPAVGALYAYAVTPSWALADEPKFLGVSKQASNSATYLFAKEVSQNILEALQSGYMVRFSASDRHGRPQARTVDLMPIGLGLVFSDYQDCVNKLIPMSFEKIRRSTMAIKGDPKTTEPELSQSDLKLLSDIVTYMLIDGEVRKLFVDGYHDGMDTEASDLDRSKDWVDLVVSELIRLGVDAAKIEQRFHGRIYANNTRNGLYRRVTLRMERLPQRQMVDTGE